MKEGWNVIVRYDEAFDRVCVYFIKQYRDGSREIIAPVDLNIAQKIEPQVGTPEPTFKFDGFDARQFLEGLADGLIQAGYLPDVLKAKDKRIDAIQYHLEDMRELVFKKRKQ